MVNIEIKTIPEIKRDEKVEERIKAIVDDRNKYIAKRFNIEPKDIGVNIHSSRSQLISSILFQGDSTGIFCGYKDGTNEFHIMNPNSISSLFKENLDKHIIVMIDYCLTKFYMCKKYYPQKSQFRIYYRYLTEILAKISSGDFREEIVKFDMKIFDEERKLSKDKELFILFYIMLQTSGLDFIYSHLDKIVEDEDIKKTIFTIYKKSIYELVKPYKEKEEEIARSLVRKFKVRTR